MAVIDNDETFERWMSVGKVAAKAVRLGAEQCKPGVRLVEVVEAVEAYITEQGMGMAFPCTVSLNECAAHYTPDHNDGREFEKGDLVKVDCGAEMEGALSDNAISVDVGATGKWTKLIETANACLAEAEAVIGPNANLGSVGAVIERVATDAGFKTIQNLTGHSLETYNLHAGLTLPNVGMKVSRRPRIGDVLACEPFVTDGQKARVENSGPGNIYHFQGARPLRMPSQKQLLSGIQRRHPKLPFAQRWITDIIDAKKLGFNLAQLQKQGLIKHYPALSEASGGMVAQRENTLIVTEDGCVVSTNPDSRY
jgi:methionyl aminopeptidase